METKGLRILCTFLVLFALTLGGRVSAFEVGTASWYGGKFQGRKTANGEIFDTNKFTAAHRTLPFHTKVKVTNLDNGKSTVVRINDRGPFVQGRIIDLSRAAAKELDMIRSGTARVRIEIVGSESGGEQVRPKTGSVTYPEAKKEQHKGLDSLPLPEPELPETLPEGRTGAGSTADTGARNEEPKSAAGTAAGTDPAQQIRYKVQLGSFSIEENARRMKEYLRNQGLAATFESGPGGIIRVVIAGVEEHSLPELIARLQKIGVQDYLLKKES